MSQTILVVEDDPDYQAQLGLHLGGAGFDVLTAQTCSTARELFAAKRPDLAIVDVMLENKDDGFILCYQFKKMDPSVPIIIVTSVTSETGIDFDVATPEERSWIKADALFHKPLRFEVLHGHIKRLMAESAQGQAAIADC